MRRLEDLLYAAAAERPDHVAIEDPGRGEWTYRELDAITNGWRDTLLSAGIEPGDRVGICARKSLSTVGAIFAILKSGAAYVPVDASAPARRNAFIFNDCTVKALFVARELLTALSDAFQQQAGCALAVIADLTPDFVLARPAHTVNSVVPTAAPLAYILYTSGSTGNPKGVMLSHSNALSFVDWCSDTFEPRADDRFSSHSPFHFDLSILDIYTAIKHACTLILIGEENGRIPARLAPLISERRITCWYSTPSILRLLLDYGKLNEQDFSSLRYALFAGEVFPTKHLRALTEIWRHPRYFNLYGPTETNVCTFYEVETPIASDRTEPFPIGKPCSHCRTRVVEIDANGIAADTPEGELLVAGDSVLQGYWNLPEQTARAFHTDSDGVQWYRTGDIVKTDSRGDYLFISRRDRMVKRRSYRVELGEIESGLYRHPKVVEAAVVAKPDEEAGVLITAFMSFKDGYRPSLIEMKQFCSANLPPYMIPDRFSFREVLPKTSTDKTDYQALKAMA